jgi:hypothetical protein
VGRISVQKLILLGVEQGFIRVRIAWRVEIAHVEFPGSHWTAENGRHCGLGRGG